MNSFAEVCCASVYIGFSLIDFFQQFVSDFWLCSDIPTYFVRPKRFHMYVACPWRIFLYNQLDRKVLITSDFQQFDMLSPAPAHSRQQQSTPCFSSCSLRVSWSNTFSDTCSSVDIDVSANNSFSLCFYLFFVAYPTSFVWSRLFEVVYLK